MGTRKSFPHISVANLVIYAVEKNVESTTVGI